MLEKIRNISLLITGLGAVFSIYLKTFNGLAMDTIKGKYKNIPGRKSVFDAIIELIKYCFIVIYTILFSMAIMSFFTSKEYEIVISSILKVDTYIDLVVILFALVSVVFPIASVSITINNFFEIKNKFIEKLENKEDIKVDSKLINHNKIGMFFSATITSIWLIFLVFIFTTGVDIVNNEGIYIFENNIPNDSISFLGILSFLAVISITSFIILNSLREIYIAINQEEYYILNINNREISCQLYLEYEEYFLIFENETEKYIKKSEVKEIIKLKKTKNRDTKNEAIKEYFNNLIKKETEKNKYKEKKEF